MPDLRDDQIENLIDAAAEFHGLASMLAGEQAATDALDAMVPEGNDRDQWRTFYAAVAKRVSDLLAGSGYDV